MTQAKAAYGTTISISGTNIAELTNIGGVDITMATSAVTNHDSADAYTEVIGTLIDAGEVPIEGNFYPGDAGQIALLTALNSRALTPFVITFPAALGTTWTFNALVVGFKAADAPVDGELPFSANIKISGKPTLAVTASAGLTTPFFAISQSAVVTPALAGNVYTYVATVLTGVTSVTVTPTAAAGVITVNGNTVATGVASSAITLGAAGSVTTITIVVTETNKTPKTYTIYLSRAAS